MYVLFALLSAGLIALGLGAGLAVRFWLEAGSWRLPEEEDVRLRRLPWEPFALAALYPLVWFAAPYGARLAFLVLATIGVALTSIDLAVHRLPDVLTLGGMAVIFPLLLLSSLRISGHPGWQSMLWSIAVAAPFLLVVALGGLGLGDVKLGILLAGALGWVGVPTAMLGLAAGFVFGGVWAGVLLMTRRARRGTHFAYGPWMLLGALAGLLATAPVS